MLTKVEYVDAGGKTVSLQPVKAAPPEQVVAVPPATPPTAPVAMGIVLAGASV